MLINCHDCQKAKELMTQDFFFSFCSLLLIKENGNPPLDLTVTVASEVFTHETSSAPCLVVGNVLRLLKVLLKVIKPGLCSRDLS